MILRKTKVIDLTPEDFICVLFMVYELRIF